jgi:hypothetical protein
MSLGIRSAHLVSVCVLSNSESTTLRQYISTLFSASLNASAAGTNYNEGMPAEIQNELLRQTLSYYSSTKQY